MSFTKDKEMYLDNPSILLVSSSLAPANVLVLGLSPPTTLRDPAMSRTWRHTRQLLQ